MKKLIFIILITASLNLICQENKFRSEVKSSPNEKIVLIKTNGCKMVSTNSGYSWQLDEKPQMTVVITKVNGDKLISTNSGYSWKNYVELNNANSEQNLTINQNPVLNDCKLNINCPKQGMYELKIYDVLGNNVMSTTCSLSNSHNEIPLNLTNLQNGRYFVVLNDGINIYNLSFIKI